MKITFNGAAHDVTGSNFLIEVNGSKLLLECGLFQGKRDETYERNLEFPFTPAEMDAVVLSHAHIDHSGNLPNLVRKGYQGRIYTTPATATLADVMLRDSGHIQESDAAFVNGKRAKRHEPPIEPLYTLLDAEKVKENFFPVEYNQQFEPVKGVKVHFVDAGHILGSAAVVLDIHEDGRDFRLWFSGDIGRLNLPLMKDPVLPQKADYLIMECTYGDKPHHDPEDAYNEFRDVVIRTVKRGGKVIIPAFAVGRTQELVYFLNRMISSREIPPIPVYVDSPLAVAATKVFQTHSNLFDEETQDFILKQKHPALFFDSLTYTESVEESKALNTRQDPMVIISASGMAETGRILHHLRNNIENPRNTILIVSWQSPETLGRRLAEREKKVKIFGEVYDRRAEVATIGGLSAHAGQDMLLKYAMATQESLKELILVHGEPAAEKALEQKLRESGFTNIKYPDRGTFLPI